MGDAAMSMCVDMIEWSSVKSMVDALEMVEEVILCASW